MSDQIEQETAVLNASSEELLKQAEEAKAREAQEAEERKQAELKACREYGLTLSEDERNALREFIDAADNATTKFNYYEDAYDELESAWSDKSYEYNNAVENYTDALQELETQKDNIEHVLEKFQYTLEKETSDNIVPDKLRQLLVNAMESYEGVYDFCRAEHVETYLEVPSPDSELCDAENLGVHLDELQKLLPEETLTEDEKHAVEQWGNNHSVWEVYDVLKELDSGDRARRLKYALSYYKPEGTGYFEMLKEMAHEFGIND